MGEIHFISLFDYLGKAAGKELGKKVALEAYFKNIPYTMKEVHNKIYSGKIMMYPKTFLDKFFNQETIKKQAVLSLSGGMDSSTLLLRLLADGYEVTALSFDYGQKHKVELDKATELVQYIRTEFAKRTDKLVTPLKHQIIKIDGLAQLLNSTLVEGGDEVPEGHYENSNMSKTVVENRNKIFSSIIQSVALATANKNNTECVIAMGIHAGDHLIYKDCREEFRDADYKAFLEGNENGERVKYYTPYLNTDKFGILKDGAICCQVLDLDFNEVYSRTNTSYKPIFVTYNIDSNFTSGKWYSDYKSASSVERVEAFIKLGRPDPVEYADEIGPVTWEHVINYVQSILDNYAGR
jgi:7-cyano-7-deazaguanine synthase